MHISLGDLAALSPTGGSSLVQTSLYTLQGNDGLWYSNATDWNIANNIWICQSSGYKPSCDYVGLPVPANPTGPGTYRGPSQDQIGGPPVLQCAAGFNLLVNGQCVPVQETCPAGYHSVAGLSACVPDTTNAPAPPAVSAPVPCISDLGTCPINSVAVPAAGVSTPVLLAAAAAAAFFLFRN